MSYTGAIPLTPDERALFDRVIFWPKDHEEWKVNAEAVPRLMGLLEGRKAIPQHRIDYFENPEYHSGRLKGSRRSIFERNGTSGRAIYEHPHFLKHLRYFVLGVDLPDDAILEFRTEVDHLAPITSDDVQELWELARRLVRKNRLEVSHAADEFFKLCLDCEVHLMYAEHIRDVVKKMR